MSVVYSTNSSAVSSANTSFALSFLRWVLRPFSSDVNKRTITLDFTNATTVNNDVLEKAGWRFLVSEKICSKKLVIKSDTLSNILPNTKVATKNEHVAAGWENKATEAAIDLDNTFKTDLILQIVWKQK